MAWDGRSPATSAEELRALRARVAALETETARMRTRMWMATTVATAAAVSVWGPAAEIITAILGW